MKNSEQKDECLTSSGNIANVMLADSALIEGATYKSGDFHNNREIKTVYDLKLCINHLGVITWYLYGSKQPHRTKWMNGEVKEVHDYHFCATAYYPDTKFSDWGEYLHKSLEYKIAENCGFGSPRAMADYLIDNYETSFEGQLVSFRDIEY